MAYIIAEIGFNHEGNLEAAKEMIHAAATAGADAVKFQSFLAEDIALPDSEHFQAIQDAEMNAQMHHDLQKVATEAGVDFLSTPFGLWAVDLLEELNVPAYKVASMDCTNHILLKRIARTGKPIYLSTGMSTRDEIQNSLAFLKKQKSGPVTLLHCISKYPPEQSELNLATIPLLAHELNVPVGYSDHFPGIEAAVTAVALGASVIETHFTLDTNKEGGDHSHSADPAQLAELVKRVVEIETMCGTGDLEETRPDRKLAQIFRRGLHAAQEIKAGQIITDNNLIVCRPSAPLGPNDWAKVKGRISKRSIKAGEALTKNVI